MIFSTLIFFAASASAEPLPSKIALSGNISEAPEALTTSKIWSVDPKEINPQRARWVVERKVELKGLKALPAGAGFKVQADMITTLAHIHLRAPGYGYDQFFCAKEPKEADLWFWNTDGARIAAKAAATAWNSVLDEKRARLEHQFKNVSASTKSAALKLGRIVFAKWITEAENEWAVKAKLEGRAAEWKHYFQTAVAQGWCSPEGRPRFPAKGGEKGGKTVWRDPPKEPSVSQLIDPIPPKGLQTLLARLPAQRWNGLFSVRVSMDAAGKIVNGHFLIDSGAAVSVISPDFLTRQGVNPVVLEAPGLSLQRVTWSGGSGLARWVQVSNAKVGVQPLGLSKLLLMETDLFSPPETVGSCCDGILGADFLRQFAVEFITQPEPMVFVYPRERFSRWTDEGMGSRPWPWVEVISRQSGDLVSDCWLENKTSRVANVRWDTGSEWGLSVHTPWASSAKGAASWDLRCANGLQVAAEIPSQAVSVVGARPTRPVADGPFEKKDPGFTAGMEVLGRSNFIFDVGNGRLWFSPDSITNRVPYNRVGVTFKYIFNESDQRELRVTQVKETEYNAEARRLGLKAGLPILKVDGVSAKTLDLWDVEQRISGVYGPTVKIEWENAKGEPQAAVLTVR